MKGPGAPDDARHLKIDGTRRHRIAAAVFQVASMLAIGRLALAAVLYLSGSGLAHTPRAVPAAPTSSSLAPIRLAISSTSSSSACGGKLAWNFSKSGHHNRTLDGRSFWVHIPDTYNHSVQQPLILSYHGFKGSDIKQERLSGFSDSGISINGKGVIAVYPAGAYGPGKNGDSAQRAWQGAPYAKHGVDDIQFTLDMISDLQDNLCVDSKRIYAAGKSNGGGLVNLLACTLSTNGRIAAFASVSPALYVKTLPLDACKPGADRVTPIVGVHGLSDRVIPFNGRPWDKKGDPNYALPSIPSWREAWAERNGCERQNHTEDSNPPFWRMSHPNNLTILKEWRCRNSSNTRAVVNGYSVHGLGHSWPTKQGFDGDTTPFDATPQFIIPFFEANAFS